MLPKTVKRQIERTAKMMSPYEYGNMRHNAIYGLLWSDRNKFKITYDLSQASYIAPQQDGWTDRFGNEHNPNAGFIDRTVLKIVSDLISYYSTGKKPSMMRIRRGELQTNEMRDLRQQRSLSAWQFTRNIQEQNQANNYDERVY